tara:strand:- start:4912 stop:5118 length:207 start_codon:yes stop_codon:yes gene_type:complete
MLALTFVLFHPYSEMTGLDRKIWCVITTHIGLFILQQFLNIGFFRIAITNSPAHCLKGELAKHDVTIH